MLSVPDFIDYAALTLAFPVLIFLIMGLLVNPSLDDKILVIIFSLGCFGCIALGWFVVNECYISTLRMLHRREMLSSGYGFYPPHPLLLSY